MNEGFIVLRQYQPGDKFGCQRIVHQAIMSTVSSAFFAALTRELTIQLMIVMAAAMFVFVGLPPSACLLSVPVSVLVIFIAIYTNHMSNAYTLTDDVMDIPRTYMSSQFTGFWVGEAYEPYYVTKKPQDMRYRFSTEDEIKEIDKDQFRRKIIATVGICRSKSDESSAWLRRMAVDTQYRRKGVANAMLQLVIQFCSTKGYESIDLVTSECHNAARELYLKKGFHLRQLYHKQIVGNVVQVLMYELTYNLHATRRR